MGPVAFAFIVAAVALVQSNPLISNYEKDQIGGLQHVIAKRFINPSLTMGDFTSNVIGKIRAKRSSDEECEKLELCKLHARSSRNFFSTFQLYFVNKENARLWDHQARSMSECEDRYSCYR